MRIVLCAPDHAGTLNQALGVAEALQRVVGSDEASPAGIRRYRRTDPILWSLPFAGRRVAAPVVISCGASGERKARRLKAAVPGIVWTHIERLRQSGVLPDLNVIPDHDWTSADEANNRAMRVLGVPHRIRFDGIEEARGGAREKLGLAHDDWAAVFLIGGPNEAFDYDRGALERIRGAIERAILLGHHCLLVPSRRTPSSVEAMLGAMRGERIRLVQPGGPHSYGDCLASADCLFVTEDSISMTCEALATRRPVFSVPMTGRQNSRLEKFRRFQEAWKIHLSPLSQFGERPISLLQAVPEEASVVADRIVRMRVSKDERPGSHRLQTQKVQS